MEVKCSAVNYGDVFDSKRFFREHIYSICSPLSYSSNPKNQALLSSSVLVCLAIALISSGLDYCNSVLTGSSQGNLMKLHQVHYTITLKLHSMNIYPQSSSRLLLIERVIVSRAGYWPIRFYFSANLNILSLKASKTPSSPWGVS